MDSINSWLVLAWASSPGDGRRAGGQAGPGIKPSLHLGRWPYAVFHRTLTASLTFKGGLSMPGVLQITILVGSSMSPGLLLDER